MTAPIGTAGTAGDGFRSDPPAIPTPRNGDDPTEPGRRRERTPAEPRPSRR